MEKQIDTQTTVNDSATSASISTPVTQACSADVHAQTKSDLRALRRKYGATSAVGRICSNIDEMLENLAKTAVPQVKSDLAVNIQKQNAKLAQLLAAARQ